MKTKSCKVNYEDIPKQYFWFARLKATRNKLFTTTHIMIFVTNYENNTVNKRCSECHSILPKGR